ncbi:SusE domain-containing protein [Puia sp.]|jgi:hypothetical protein|uniref:SusE domain-containing protein n=1 Tax=Puia sp. TaxID=2045100 RepID=UPI002F3EDAA7
MKKLFYITSLALGIFIAGCKRELPQATLQSPAAISGFTASSNTIVLSTANDSVMVAVFKWPALTYGASVPVTYTLLIDQAADTAGATGWSNALRTTITTDSLSKSWLGTDFNHLVNQLGLTPGVASAIVVRLKVDVNQSNGTTSAVAPLTSDLGITVTPYKVFVKYPELFVAGDFLIPNWVQKDQPGWILASVKSNSTYEGYVNFPNSSNLFKLCVEPDWNGTAYGWGGTQTTMSPTGGNLYFGGPGYCRVVADVTALTLSFTPTAWYVAGDFNSWSTTATPMTFDAVSNTWKASGVALTGGTNFKFVSMSDWDNQYGLDSKGNLVLGNSSGNIPVTKSGTFTVTLDLSQGAGNYGYSVQ